MAEPHSLEDTRNTIRLTFNGAELEDLFLDFDPEPLGVGAIAQVYRAKLKANFTPKITKSALESELFNKEREKNRPVPEFVAVKVLHPTVKETVNRDLIIMEFLANFLNRIPTLQFLSLPDEVSTFGSMMRSQLNLKNEAENLLKLRDNFKNIYTAKFPRPIVDWVSEDVLVEKYEHGVPIKYFLQAKSPSPYDVTLSAIGLDSFLHMLIFDNFTHADLHPGNIMIKFYQPSAQSLFKKSLAYMNSQEVNDESEQASDVLIKEKIGSSSFDQAVLDLYHQGYYPRLVFLDAGLVASLDEVRRRDFLELFQAIAEFDGFRAGTLMAERCRSPELVEDKDIFALKMQHLMLDLKRETFQLAKFDVSSLLQTVMQMVREHRVKLEGDFVNIVISILILEGIGRKLNPDIDLFKMALPILRSFGTQDGTRNSLAGLDNLPGGTSWWLKFWFQLEARQWLSTMTGSTDSIELDFFGQFKPMFLDG